MLVLSRKQNERIRVGDSVVVTVVRVSGDKVRIGIEAPADVRVLRDELDERHCRTRSATQATGWCRLVDHYNEAQGSAASHDEEILCDVLRLLRCFRLMF